MDNVNYTPPLATDSAEPQKNEPSALGDIIGKLMSNPEIMSAIASMKGQSSPEEPASEENNEPKENEESTTPASSDISSKLPEVIEALSPMLSGKGKGDGKPSPRDDRRICLLRAIKPYVSRGRSDAIDYMIQLSRITELMKHIN